MQRISSRQNALVKRFRDVAHGRQPGVMLLDGAHLLTEALASRIRIEAAAFADDAGSADLIQAVERAGVDVFHVSTQVLSAMSPVREPSGVVAIAARPPADLDAVFAKSPALVIMLSDVQDPGNVGAAIRAAEGCGATGVICSEASADPFGWKALRGAMGSTFRVPVAPRQALSDAVSRARAGGLRVFATIARDGTPLPDCDLRGPAAVLFGSEGRGLPDALISASDERMTIPMQGAVESLNVSVAAALVVYEAARQRRAHR